MEASLRTLERLGAMDVREVAHRTQERLRRGLDRAAHRLGAPEESDRRFLGRLPASRGFVDYLANRVAGRFYVPTSAPERRQLVALVAEQFPDWLPRIEAEAERLCAHRIEVLGHGELDFGPVIDWHRDPVSGARWEPRFWTDYDLVRDESPGDPKRIHEANRHQHLPRLAKAYFLLDQERYAQEVVDQLLGWIEQNPRGVGVHWHSSLEIALRVISWMWALPWIEPSRALDEAAASRIGKSLFAQLDHICTYPSVYTSPNTHLIGEAAALVVAGLLFVDSERGRAWLARGTSWLTGAFEQQVGADGVHAELSTCYHCYALDFGLQALALARRNRHQLPASLEHRVASMLEFVAQVTRPDGSLPLLGDDDGGRALALESTSYLDPGDLLCTGAVLFGGHVGATPQRFRETTLWLLGREGHDEWRELPATAPSSLRASFPAAGYFVQRTGWRPWDSHLVFDCGGLGELGGGHGHADALSLTLFAGGRELLVDPGTFVYNGSPEWRNLFRSTAAHNTAVVDGRSQSEPGDTFRWRTRARSRLLHHTTGDGVDYLAGEHDGYAQEPNGVVHRRRLLFVRPHYWIVLDDFRGDAAEHEFALVFHLAPDAETSCSVDNAGREATVDAKCGPARLGMFLHASSSLQVTTTTSIRDPAPGWVSGRYGEKSPAPVVVARFRARPPAAAVTLLLPGLASAGALPWRLQALAVNAPEAALGARLAVRIGKAPGAEEVLLFSPDAGEIATGPYRANAELVLASTAGGRLDRVFTVGATSFTMNGVAALDAADASLADASPPTVSAGGPPDVPAPASGANEDEHVRHRRNL